MTDIVDELAKVISTVQERTVLHRLPDPHRVAKAVLDSGLVVPKAERDEAQAEVERQKTGREYHEHPGEKHRWRQAVPGGVERCEKCGVGRKALAREYARKQRAAGREGGAQ